MCLLCLSFAGSAASQERCTSDARGSFRCVGVNGQTQIAPLDGYRASSAPNLAGAGIAPIGALKVAPSGPRPLASASGGSLVIISAGKPANAASVTSAPKTCSWDSVRGVQCE
jgi:hypothetical protein